ncbi:SorU family sulfite dehydrogenase c-type cytochrome subunit [Caenimonas soli]|uniref:SorU family sulfite dehydrogenase c-type cytochrome subunit n=1 Tax=Caenimonas soli TaxID=2735555 RepID=UPI001F2550A7|nr:cytochrome c [Caenimonas soli]
MFWRAALLLSLVAAASASMAAEEEGKRLFMGGASPACMLCHALKDAGAEGAVGPSLDELKPDAARVVKALKNGIGQMPAYPQLTEAQIQALARYVEQATRK